MPQIPLTVIVMCSFDASYSIHIMLDPISGLPSSRQLVLIIFPLYAGPVISRQHPGILIKSLFLHVPRVNPVILQPCHDAFPEISTGLRFKTNIYMYKNYLSPSNGFSQDQGRIFWAVNLGEHTITIISRLYVAKALVSLTHQESIRTLRDNKD